ncbi:MAG: hypothetical protein AB9873_12225 [Syntrophobacteraceae bacterium]
MRKRWGLIGIGLMMVVGLVWVNDGAASRPVSKTLSGCVIGDTFYSVEEGFPGERKGDPVVYRITVRDMDLTPYEGKKIQMKGHLLPGDRFTPEPGSLRVLGPCDKASRKAIEKTPF